MSEEKGKVPKLKAVIETFQGRRGLTVSMLQRTFGIGYTQAADLMDEVIVLVKTRTRQAPSGDLRELVRKAIEAHVNLRRTPQRCDICYENRCSPNTGTCDCQCHMIYQRMVQKALMVEDELDAALSELDKS